MNKYVKKEIEFGGRKLSLETGELAGQSNMAVKVSYADTVVLTTVVSAGLNPDLDYFPLSVNYEEKLYASGSIKSSRFVKRDGRPTDEATVTRRLVDHAIRPLFPTDYLDEVQVINMVLSLDPVADPKLLSLIGASAALTASDIPWEGPMVSAVVGYVADDYILNPSIEELEKSKLNLTISFIGQDLKYLAMEASADMLPEEVVLGAVEFARNRMEPLLALINEFVAEINPSREKYEYLSMALPKELIADVKTVIESDVRKLIYGGFKGKNEFSKVRNGLLDQVYEKFEGKYKKTDMAKSFEEIEKDILQSEIITNEKRPDGRALNEVREIKASVGVLPRTHGSAVFSRGVTQVLTVATLGSPSMEMLIQDMYGEESKKFIHFYSFPPFSVGEVGRMTGAGGREIGHGMLGEVGLKPIIPSQEEFPYTIILNSETLSSSGSSSMASACGSVLALMDAGVPIKEMVAGIGVGLLATDDFSEFKIITDLAHREDAFGLLDFKMIGTNTGVTAIQSDTKAKGIPMDLLPKIFEQSREGRLHVLAEMRKTLTEPRASLSEYAPKSRSLKIDPDKIGMVIGSGGKMINQIQDSTGTVISIDDDGTVVVSAVDINQVNKAYEWVEAIVKDVLPGEVYEGTVEEVVDFGAFVEILPGKTGLLHVSEISHDYVDNVSSVLKAGDKVTVKVLEVKMGKISLSIKALQEKPAGARGSSTTGFGDKPRKDFGPRRPDTRRNSGRSDRGDRRRR